ncbi:MAG TPA: co-chaperone GroES [Rubrobacteraceae bacterium]|nr:co-chaperone GroES [Rubrobacteraceae bacterium]
MVKLKPIGERALVKSVEQESETASGIILPETAKGKPQTAQVVAIGDSEEVGASEGDVVVFAKYSGRRTRCSVSAAVAWVLSGRRSTGCRYAL